MNALLGGLLPWAYSQGDRAKRYVGGLLSDPVGTMEQTGGLLMDRHREHQNVMAQAFSDPNRPFKVTNQNALLNAINNGMGLLGPAPVGMTVKSAAMGKGYQGADEGPNYQISHKPMTVEGGAARLHDLESVFGPDIYGANARQFFGSGGADVWGQAERATLRKMAELRGKPDAMVTIYRGVPDGVNAINSGDWVTLDPRVAREYGRVISMQVPASHITSWPDSLLEFGYFPSTK